jgi:hypothetical protein
MSLPLLSTTVAVVRQCMPSLSTELTLRALVQVRLPGRGEGMVVGEAATFVAERWQQLSPFARQLVTLLVTLFALQCRLVTGRAFDRLDLVRRRWLVQRLAGGGPLGRLLEFVDPLGACRTLGDRGAGVGEQCQFFANLRRIASYLTKICRKVALLSRFCG